MNAGLVKLVDLLRRPHDEQLAPMGERALGIRDGGVEESDRRAVEFVAAADGVTAGVGVLHDICGVKRILKGAVAEDDRLAGIPHSVGLRFVGVAAANRLVRDGDDFAGAEQERSGEKEKASDREGSTERGGFPKSHRPILP